MKERKGGPEGVHKKLNFRDEPDQGLRKRFLESGEEQSTLEELFEYFEGTH